jgi:hypothetical protein
MVFYMQAIAARLDGPSDLPPPVLPPFKAEPAYVRVNVVWFGGLVLSLVAGLVGILGKQWLREYVSQRLAAPRDAVRLRQFRYAGLVRWRVSDIFAMLPLLLQAALVLFIIGLLDLLWAIVQNTVVAAVASALVGVSFVAVGISVLLPLFYPECPYKSPLALQIRSLSSLIQVVLTRGPFSPSIGRYTGSLTHGWYDADTSHLISKPEESIAGLEHSALTWAHHTILSDAFQDSLAPCIHELPPHLRVHFVHALLCQCAGLSQDDLVAKVREGPRGANTALHRGMLRAGHSANARLLGLLLDVLPDASRFQGKRATTLTQADLLITIHPLLNAFVWTGKQRYSTRDATTRRVYEVLLDILGYEGQAGENVEAVFGLLLSFDHLFWKHVTHAGKIHALLQSKFI